MKWLVRLVLILVLIIAVVIVSLIFLPGERIARIAADQISAATGRQVEMTGDTKVSFYPVLGISTGATTVSNADWSNAGPMLKATSLKVGVDFWALVSGEIRITGLEVVQPEIILERAGDGRVNWEIGVDGVATTGQSSDEAPAVSTPLALTLDRALITAAAVKYIDHAAGTETAMKDMDFDIRWPSYQGEATFDATLRPAGEEVSVTGRVDKVGALIAGQLSGLEVRVKTRGGQIGFVGRGSTLPQLDGQLNVELDNTSRFMTSLGLAPVDVPKGLGQAAALSAQLIVTEDMRVSMRDLVLRLDQNRFSGGADLYLAGAKPRVEAKLAAGALDLSALESGSAADSSAGGDTSATAVSDGWPRDTIDVSALGLADAEIAISAESLDLGTFKFGATRVLTTVDNARAVFNLKELNGYGGVVSGQFVANNRSGLSVGGDMSARGIDMEKFLTDAAGITRFAATGDASLKFIGVGQSVDAIMKSLNGDLSITTGRGVISGFDLDRLMRSGDVTGGTTVFDSMSATFDIRDGNMYNNDLAMSMPLARATGEGRIGLGAQDIDYTFTPSLLEGDKRKGLAIPVRIRGPWANPRITPDLEAAIDLNFKEEKDKLKEDARDEVGKFVEKELGVTVEEGESVEDAIKKEVEDAVVDELFKLFD